MGPQVKHMVISFLVKMTNESLSRVEQCSSADADSLMATVLFQLCLKHSFSDSFFGGPFYDTVGPIKIINSY